MYEFLAFRPDNPNSIVQCITKARENARTIRDRISREMWEDINGLYHSVTRFDPAEQISSGPHRFCDAVKFGSHRFFGVTDATLPHDEGWDFLKIGWSLERAEMTARLVDLQFQSLLETPFIAGTADNHQWMAVLKSVGAYEAYRRQYHSPIEPERVAEMLILHPKHPRSIRFSITELQVGLRAISGTAPGSYANEAERLTGKVLESLRYDTVEDIFRRGLHDYLTSLLSQLPHHRRRHCPHLLLLRSRRMNRYHLVHVTEFVYDGPVSESYNEVRLRPMHDETQSCLSFRLTTVPASPAFSYRDALGNWVHQVNILPVHSRLRVQAESVVLAHSVRASRQRHAAERVGGATGGTESKSFTTCSRPATTFRTWRNWRP